MSKVLMFTDAHITPVKGLSLFEETALSCINACIDYAEKHGIKTIWCLGDTFFAKTYIENYLFSKAIPTFERFKKFNTIFLIGNHDIATDGRNTDYSLLEVFKPYIHVCNDPFEQAVIDGNNFVFVNYLNNHLIRGTALPVKKGSKNILLAHTDCDGFYTNAKHRMENSGYTVSSFKRWDIVFSGHYHKRSKIKNIQYIGNTHHMRVSDAGNPYGFTILDTKTLEYTFHEYENYAPPCYVEMTYSEAVKTKLKNNFITIKMSEKEKETIPEADMLELENKLRAVNHGVVVNTESTSKLQAIPKASNSQLLLSADEMLSEYLMVSDTKLPHKELLDRITGRKKIALEK